MGSEEKERIAGASNWYLQEQLDFDKRLIRFRYLTFKEQLRGPNGLELGPAEGEMTQFLVKHFKHLTLVEGAENLLNKIPNYENVSKVNALFEEFEPSEKYDSIILEHVLEHVDEPKALLERVRHWLSPEGLLFIGVPNAHSIHRLAAVKMGLLEQPTDLNDRDIALGHRRVYTPETFINEIQTSGLSVDHWGGVYFKPLSNGQIENTWTEDMIEGFYQLGKDFPEIAAELYAVCRL